MKTQEAAALIRQLLTGTDPETGEILPSDHLLHSKAVREALLTALQAMGAQDPDGRLPVNRSGRLDAGRPWSVEELADLRRLYESGVSIDEIARLTHRRARGIRLQLNLMAGGSASLMGRVDIPDVCIAGMLPPLDPDRVRLPPENGYQPWTASQEERLAEMYAAGRSIPEISHAMKRTTSAIRTRLKRCGLDPDKAGKATPTARTPSDAAPTRSRETLAHLKKLHAEGRSISEIAQTTGLSQSAVISCLQKLALLPDEDNPASPSRHWTQEDAALLRSMHKSGLPIGHIAARMNRTEEAISARLVSLGLGGSAPSLLPPDTPVPTRQKASAPPAPPPEKVTAAPPPSRHWTREDDAYLRQAWAEGVDLNEIVRQTGRHDRLVRCRLIFLGLADHSLLGGPPVPPELAHQGLPWYPEEIETLMRMHHQGRSHGAMAAELKRSVDVIRSRLEILGLENTP